MAIEKQSSSFVEVARVTLENIDKNSEVKTLLEAKSYDAARFQEGQERFDALNATIQLRISQKEQAASKRIETNAALAETKADFSNCRQRLRSYYRAAPETVSSLCIGGQREHNSAKFIVQAGSFYDKILNTPEILALSETAGVSAAQLTDGLNKLNAYKSLRTQYVSLKGSMQRLKELREAQLRHFKAWFTALVFTLKSMYKNNPQALEELGIFVRNKPPKKKETEEPSDSDSPTGNDTPTDTGEPEDPADPVSSTEPTTPAETASIKNTLKQSKQKSSKGKKRRKR